MKVMVPRLPIGKAPNTTDKKRLVVYLKPKVKEALSARAATRGISVTKFVEELIKRGIGA